MGNPFAPGFGTQPPLLAGRDGILRRIASAMIAGPRHPDSTLVITGARGTGKTVLLNAVEADGRSRGWAAIAVSASEEGGLTYNVTAAASDPNRWPQRWKQQAVGFEADVAARLPFRNGDRRTLRASLTDLSAIAARREAGVLITVDELQAADAVDAQMFANAIQHVVRREQRPVMFIGAGLPEVEDTVLADDGITFFQRCRRVAIGPISNEDVRTALEQPVIDAAGWIEPAALDTAVAAASGYPFMVQLIGFHAWEHSPDPRSGITTAAVAKGLLDANDEMVNLVIKPVWKRLSEADRAFLMAMAQDSGDSSISNIAARLRKSSSHVGVYRSRLIRAGVIRCTRRGHVRFTHESMRQWLINDHR
ncbi:MAG: ATP-binding protein [Acidimicrobiaceae bacterium]|nr:ATP-binding protein [Acidimicrobiaceae bacterium]